MALSQTQSKFSFEFRDSNWVKGVIGVTPTNWSVHRSIHPAIGSKGCRCVFSWKWGGLLTQAKGVSQTKALFTVLLVLATEQNFKRTLFLCAVKFSLFWASTSWHGKDSPSAFCNLCFLCTSTSQRSPNRKKGEDLIVYVLIVEILWVICVGKAKFSNESSALYLICQVCLEMQVCLKMCTAERGKASLSAPR